MITPDFPISVYAKRREKLADKLRPSSDLIIFFNAPEYVRNNDNFHPFRADSSFIYLTGFHEPHSAFLLWKEKKGTRTELRTQLFCQKRDPLKEMWTGKITGPERASKAFGIKEAFAFDDLEKQCQEFFKTIPAGVAPRIFSNAREHAELNSQLERLLENIPYNFRSSKLPLESLVNIGDQVRKLRLIKDSHELKLMEKASEINVQSHLSLMKAIRPGWLEYQAQAHIEYEFRNRGAHSLAYGSICAAGGNATCLHYRPSNDVIKDGQLFLVDAGCELHHYASDITRTYPVNGRFTKEQRNIYDIVVEAHQETLQKSRSGTLYSKLHETASIVIIEGLKTLKFLKGKTKDILEKGEHRNYFPHGTGHWLGLDVHDPCPVTDEKGKSLKLEPGMVFTIEPGIYFQDYDKTVPKEYRGIGIRIEDDILVTSSKPKNLTAGLPTTSVEIEKFMMKR